MVLVLGLSKIFLVLDVFSRRLDFSHQIRKKSKTVGSILNKVPVGESAGAGVGLQKEQRDDETHP